MTQHLFIGVDGGATKCVVRLEDEAGELLGLGTSGPANIRLSVDQAWQSIDDVLNNILQSLSITRHDKKYCFHVGMGLAGSEVVEAYEAFVRRQHIFNTFVVTSDSHIACLGAHEGQDGAIIIAGTGVVGFQAEQGVTAKVGGWGFPHDDEGGGAWLGLEAVRETFKSLDGRQAASDLSQAIYAYFGADRHRLVSWSNKANSTTFAELAPLVVQQAQLGDKVAIGLLQTAAQALESIGLALEAAQENQAQPLPCALVGSIAPLLEPYFNYRLRSRLRPCRLTPDAGAVLLARQAYAMQKEAK